MKRVPGPVHAVAVTPWREFRARPWTTALSTAQGHGQPLRGSAVAHRLPTNFAFGLTRRCASCPNDTHHRSFPRHRYTLPIYNGSTRFALPIPGCFRLTPELEKTLLMATKAVKVHAWLGCTRLYSRRTHIWRHLCLAPRPPDRSRSIASVARGPTAGMTTITTGNA